jgi:hypothetical protein
MRIAFCAFEVVHFLRDDIVLQKLHKNFDFDSIKDL